MVIMTNRVEEPRLKPGFREAKVQCSLPTPLRVTATSLASPREYVHLYPVKVQVHLALGKQSMKIRIGLI